MIPEEVFELFPVLKSMLGRRGGDLSGGQQQQLAIGRALVTRPGCSCSTSRRKASSRRSSRTSAARLLLREPEGDGHPPRRAVFRLRRELADRFVVMERGEIVQRATASALEGDDVRQRWPSEVPTASPSPNSVSVPAAAFASARRAGRPHPARADRRERLHARQAAARHPDGLDAVLVNTAGGIAVRRSLFDARSRRDGRAVDGRDTRGREGLSLGRAGVADAVRQLTLGPGAQLDWLPQETILFDGAVFAGALEVDIAEDAQPRPCRSRGLRPRARWAEQHRRRPVRATAGASAATAASSTPTRAARRADPRSLGSPASAGGARAFATFSMWRRMPRRDSKSVRERLSRRRRRCGGKRLERASRRALLRHDDRALAPRRHSVSSRLSRRADAARLAQLEDEP